LKFGLYSAAGNTTCGGRVGSRGHEYQDALQFARWGVDYLKYDWCDTDGLEPESAYTTMRDALRATKRPVTFSISEWGTSYPWKWAATVGHLWRTTGDVMACFNCVEEHGTWKSWGVLPILDKQDGLRAFAGPGHWNDPDMLEVGNGMTFGEDRAHFSLWAMLAAPLIAGNDLVSMKESTRDLLTNPEVIAVDQDILGIQGFRYRTDGELDVWVRPLSRGQLAVLFLNRGQTPLGVHFEWSKHRVKDDLTHKHYDFGSTVYAVRDVWDHKQLGTTKTPLSTTLQSHEVTLLRLTPQK
jgi:alpha-galactosidase